MFIDTAKIYIKAGDGGDGCNSFERDQSGRKLRPNGGPGGKGGDVVFKVDKNVHTLLDFQYRQHFEACRGSHGSSNNKKGAFGNGRIIKIPAGTIILKDRPSCPLPRRVDPPDTFKGGVLRKGLIKEFHTRHLLTDLTEDGQTFIACKGGDGGRGNSSFRPAEKGKEGEEKTVLLELKLIADAGLIGYPNVGKSTLISRISKARPKIADYPFTTKEPVLGVARFKGNEFVVADIPGLIEGAHRGRGLGDKFLRHIERTKVLIHLIDMSGLSQRDPIEDYKNLNNELGLYSEALAEKPQIVVANKMDVGRTAEGALKKFRGTLKKRKVISISALKGEGIEKLLLEINKVLRKYVNAD